jgi:DMSO/TMAO reductase YedYZ heme-binding membrane subunit
MIIPDSHRGVTMKHLNLEFEEDHDIEIGPLKFSQQLFLSLYGTLALIAFLVARAVGIEPGMASTAAEHMLTMNVIWALFVLLISLALSRFCTKPEHAFLRRVMPLCGAGLVAGALISLAI